MSAEHGAPKRLTRRRATIVASAATVGAAGLIAALALNGAPGAARARPRQARRSMPRGRPSTPRSPGALQAIAKTAGSGASYYAYIAAETGSEVVEVNVSAGTIVGTISADSVEGVADHPGRFLPPTSPRPASTTSSRTISRPRRRRRSRSAPTRRTSPLSPTGKVVYATVTSGDTGPGGSDVVAAIDPATNTVTADSRSARPHGRWCSAPTGLTAYVTTETGIYEISTATNKVVRVIPDLPPTAAGYRPQPQRRDALRHQPWRGHRARARRRNRQGHRRRRVGAEPYSVTVTPNGSTLYVADMDSDSVSVLSAATLKASAKVSVGRLPMSVTVSPDGSQVWVGNGFTGDVSVISTATNSVVATLARDRHVQPRRRPDQDRLRPRSLARSGGPPSRRTAARRAVEAKGTHPFGSEQ